MPCSESVDPKRANRYAWRPIGDHVADQPCGDRAQGQPEVAVAEGVFTKIELSLDQTKAMEKHRCEEAGEKFDEAQVCTPTTLYQIAGLGATIR